MPTRTPLLLLPLLVAAALGQDPVLIWNRATVDAIRATNTPPPRAARLLAITHAAVHDAVNGIVGRYEQYLVPPGATAPASASAAATAAAYTVLSGLLPSQLTPLTTLRDQELAALPAGLARTNGVQWGTHVAQQLLAARANDGANAVVTFPGSTAPGWWRPTESFGGQVLPALLPQWGQVTCFTLPAASGLRPGAPPALPSIHYALEVMQVREWGGQQSQRRNAEQTEIAHFWAYGPNTATPPGHWNQVADAVVAGSNLDLAARARLYALLNLAMADAAIVSWECKYTYSLWRPITAIQLADQDGNRWTAADPNWRPLLPTPPFPEYVSGHSTFSGAAAAVLAAQFGDKERFSVGSDDLPGVRRHYKRFSEAAWESGMSRIYGGIHFLSGNLEGLVLGDRVGRHAIASVLRPVQ